MTIIEQIPLLYRTTKSWFKNNGRYAYGITICFFLLLASFIALFAVNQSVDKQNTLLENRYGEQISRTAANKLKSATINNDLISMQAELKELTQKETIVSATIYDLNNQVKVQSGAPNDTLKNSQEYSFFSTPITQDETVLGQLTIALLKMKDSTAIALPSIAIFLSALFALVWLLVNTIKSPQKNHSTEETDPIADEITQSTELEKTTVNLLLQLKNIDDMFRQFSKQAQDEKYRDVKSSIQKSLKIYNGKIDAIDAQSIFITLSDNDEQQAVLNAICCAGLLLKTAREQRWFLKINAVIYQMENTINDTDKIAALKHIKEHSKESIFIEENAATLADSRISLLEPNKKHTHFLEIEKLCEQYETLLSNQFKHLDHHQ